ncbi:YlcG family protein [Enterobacter hormaechei]
MLFSCHHKRTRRSTNGYRGSVLVDYRIFRNYIRIESKQRGT